jgi:PatG C-terminal
MLTIEGLDTYVLTPRDPIDFDLLTAALRASAHTDDLDAVIGERGPLAPPETCGGSMLPVVVFDQIYSFDRDALVKAIPRPKEIPAKGFTSAANELLTRIMQLADNAGATDDHRALNYLVLRYPAIYATAAECHGRELSLTGVDTRLSRLAGARNVVDVVLSFTHRRTDVTEKYFVRVDVTEEFPFLSPGSEVWSSSWSLLEGTWGNCFTTRVPPG